MTNHRRRLILQGVIVGTAGILTGCGSTGPRNNNTTASASNSATKEEFIPTNNITTKNWPVNSFDSTSLNRAIKKLYGRSKLIPSDEVKIDAPVFAESSEMVPITVSTTIDSVQNISIFVKNNYTPLCVNFSLSKNMDKSITTRVKMEKTSDIVAVVKSGGTLFTNSVDTIIKTKYGCT